MARFEDVTTPTMLSRDATVEQVLELLDRDGFAVVERYLSPDDVEAKKADLERVLASVPTGRNDFEGFVTQRIYAIFAKTRVFDAQAIDPLITGVCDKILGPGFQLSAPVGISIGPGEKAQVLHTDDGVYPFPRPHRELVLNTMWALDDFTEDNGATVVVPGSHKWTGERPADDAPRIRATMPAGSVMFFVGSVFHGGGANNTERRRLGVILEYCAGFVRPQENHVLGVPKEIIRDLDPKLQELLGYNVVGLLGNVDGRHPRKYIDDQRTVADGRLVL
ncbi:MAG TPA: phytanoyl-CoA dioxygenase family protein [Actinomycetota bacterium]|jgi:ectoine hydroxylase-related dioxygenase (phytanoyl-CoA dioxygenase family)|nr:phytanoyl-CoA dioxygenase family protein [Actinomycetota bacterium]